MQKVLYNRCTLLLSLDRCPHRDNLSKSKAENGVGSYDLRTSSNSNINGAYTVLFGLAMWILPRKFHIPSIKKFIFPAIIVLFVLVTMNIAYDLVGEAYAIMYTIPVVEKPWLIVGQSIDSITFVFADILGDLVLLYRVYAVWGSRKRVLFPMLLLMGSAKGLHEFCICSFSALDIQLSTFFSVLGILAAIAGIHQLFNVPQTGFFDYRGPGAGSLAWPNLFEIVNAISNMLMTLMIAGRVWWISRSLQKELKSGVHPSHWYRRTLAVVTESGVIYPVYLTIEVVVSASPVPFNIPNYVDMGIVIVGLAPTLIAVRVGLGSAVDDQSLRSSILQSQLLFATRPRSLSAPVLDIAPVGDEYSARSSIPDLGRDVEKGLREVELSRGL
ncbi:hypothetical protein BT96DRAFT_1017622 [Gymnopus androsaceus JB14]|uniref:Uncharacterized protein n=1 Tax=Gymnopus androsaceus JB14 TaxID=1447944 RepID=A0A6A4HZY4_9AGAR|nr:hypothetical protein BT96DRAFT_1017622 [Gymnopus androsaceus JB14]